MEIRGKRTYYYKKERHGDKVVSRYVGKTGCLAWQVETLIAAAREERRSIQGASTSADRAEAEALHLDVGLVAKQVRELSGLVMHAAGFHQHARGPWRKRRMAKSVNICEPGKFPPKGQERVAFVDRAEAGDETTRLAIADLFVRLPGEVAKAGGNLAGNVEDQLIRRYAGKNIIIQESIRAKLNAMRSDLAGPDPTPIERLLAERVATCWLAAYTAEAEACITNGDGANRADRRCVTAHNRYIGALKALALVQRLALPEIRATINLDQRSQTVKLVQPDRVEVEGPKVMAKPTNPTPKKRKPIA